MVASVDRLTATIFVPRTVIVWFAVAWPRPSMTRAARIAIDGGVCAVGEMDARMAAARAMR